MAASMENVKDKHGFVHDEQLIDPMQTQVVATTDEWVTIRGREKSKKGPPIM